MPKFLLLLLVAALVPSLSCNNCDRSACDSFSKAASSNIGQGIAGSVSLESDQVADGCPICGLSEAGLDVWKATAAVHDAAAGCALVGTPSTMAFTVIGRYDRALDPGDYVVCVAGHASHPCIGLNVAPGKVSTLNIKHTYGLSSVAVLDSTSNSFRSDVFSCPSGS